MRLIRRVSRLVALALSIVLANASLASGGSACMMAGDASMAMSGHPTAPHHAMAASTTGSHASGSAPAPCHLPTAPNGCVGMATCATVALPSVAVAVTTARPAGERVIDRTVVLAPGDARAPELPPPRA